MLLQSAPKVHTTFSEIHNLVVLNKPVEAALKDIPKGQISLIVSSPPYNIGKIYEKQVSLAEYLEWQKSVIEDLVERLSPQGSICWQVGNYIEDGEVFPLDIYFYRIFKELGLQLRNRIIWHFDHGLHAKNRFSGRYETILWFSKTDDYVFNLDPVRIPAKYPGKLNYKGKNKGLPSGNPLGKNPSDFWVARAAEWEEGIFEIPNVKSNHPEKTIHPCQFPVELVERCVLALTNEDDWVLDPFGGIGTALIASSQHGRRAVVIDRDKDYCELAEKRLIDFYEGRLKIRPIGKPVHQPSGREKVSQIPELWLQSDAGSK